VVPQLPQLYPQFYQGCQKALADRFPYTLDDYQLLSPQPLAIRLVPVAQGLAVYCRDITVQKATQGELQYYAAREQLLVSIDQRIRQSLNLEEILHTAVEEIRRFFEADRVLLYQFNDRQEALLMAASCAPSWTLNLSQQNLAVPWLPLISPGGDLDGGDLLPVEDLSPVPCFPWDQLPETDLQSRLTVPIFQNDRRWGILTVHQCDHYRQWQMVEINVLEELATQIAIAIQQSQLYRRVQHLNSILEQKVQERTEQLEQAIAWEAMLKRITDRVRDSLDEHQILQQAVKELAIALNVSSCNAALYNLEERTSTIYYEFVTTIPASQGRVAKMADYPEIYDQLLQGQYFQFCSITPSPVRGYAAMLACPIFDDGGILGDLWLINQADHAFSDGEIRFVQQAANQCAIALRQAKLYQAAQDQVAKLEEINRLKDEFLSTVSHELRTPMTNLKMAIQMLHLVTQQQQQACQPVEPQPGRSSRKTAAIPPDILATLARIHPKQNHYLEILRQECDREIQLINDLLDLQRLEANAQTVQWETLDMGTWLPQQAQAFYDRTRQRQQTLHLDISPTLPPLTTDAAGLERIIAELLNNACKYTPPGQAIHLAAYTSPEDLLHLAVINFGVEIPPTEQHRVFDKFYRIASNDPWKQGGTGLGLALVQQLVHHLGGQITLDSSDLRTCFTLTLPLQAHPKSP